MLLFDEHVWHPHPLVAFFFVPCWLLLLLLALMWQFCLNGDACRSDRATASLALVEAVATSLFANNNAAGIDATKRKCKQPKQRKPLHVRSAVEPLISFFTPFGVLKDPLQPLGADTGITPSFSFIRIPCLYQRKPSSAPPVTQKRSSRVTDGETGRRCRRWGRCRGEQKAVGLADLRRGSRWYPGQVSRLANEKTWRRCPACYLCSSRFPTEHQQHEILVVFLHTFISASIHRPVLGSNFPTWQNTHHGCSVLAFHLSVIWNHNIQHSSWQNNTVTWLTQHIGNAQEWGGIWPPSLQTPSYASVSAAQRKRRAAQPPEEEMTWWQKCYNVAPVKTMPTLKRGVVLCWVGTMFFM